MQDFVVILVILVVLAAAALYIRKEKKRGKACVGCPYGGCCGKDGCGCGK